MTPPIEQAQTLQQVVDLVEQSNFYTLFTNEMEPHERQLLLAAPSAAAHCLNSAQQWMANPKEEIHLLLLNPAPLDAVDEGRSWGILPLLLGFSPLTPIHLTIVGQEIVLANSSSNSKELRSITVSWHQQPPIEFLLEHPEYRADAAFLMHPDPHFSLAGIHTLRELQHRGVLLFGACFSSEDGEQLGSDLSQRDAAQFAWHQSNPFSLPLQQFTDSDAIWASSLWQLNPEPLTRSADQRVGDLTRQTVLNIIEGGEVVTAQYLSDLQSEQSALTTILNLLALLDLQSRTELSAHLFWSIFSQIRRGDIIDQRNELLQLTANLSWIGAAEAALSSPAIEPQQDLAETQAPEPEEDATIEEVVTEETAAVETAVAESAIQETAIEELVAEEITIQEPVTEKLVAEETAIQEPAAEETVLQKFVAENNSITIEKSTIAQSTIEPNPNIEPDVEPDIEPTATEESTAAEAGRPEAQQPQTPRQQNTPFAPEHLSIWQS